MSITNLPDFEVILTREEIDSHISKTADELVPILAGSSWTAIVILLGATPFASDLIRALALRGVDIGFDALWLESYHDARESSGRVVVRADIQRPIEGRGALILDDVFDTGRTIEFARAHLLAKGAREVRSCVFARKPDAAPDGLDVWSFDAPPKYLVGYGMDDAGKWRGLPYLGAVKD